MSLLLLDDEEIFNKLLSFVCKQKGIDYYYAQNIAEAKDLVDKKDISVVIIDQNLKNEKGVEFNNYIKFHYPQIKSILSSGYTDDIEKNDLGKFDFLVEKSEMVKFISELFDIS